MVSRRFVPRWLNGRLLGVAAHKIGHVFGAIDLPQGLDYHAQDRVMAKPANWCTTENRCLGYGDFQFLVSSYP